MRPRGSRGRSIPGELLLFPDLEETEPSRLGPSEEVDEEHRSERRPADWIERERALDVTQSWIVEAPAGSGKTGLLLQRYLKLLGDESVSEPEEVLAITFTRAATEEIRERIVGELERSRTGNGKGSGFAAETRRLAQRALDRSGERGWGLLERSYRMRVKTIDSVCAEIARSMPMMTSGAGQRSAREDASELYRRAARRTLLRMGGPDAMLTESLSLLLLHRDGNVFECEQMVAEMLPSREQWRDLVPCGADALTDEALEAEVLPRLNHALEQAVCAVLTEVSDAFPTHLLRRLSLVAAEMGHIEAYKTLTSPIAICVGREQPPEARAEHVAHWRALIHLLVAPSAKEWRKSFNKNHMYFDTGVLERKRLKDVVDEVQFYPELLDLLCSVQDLPPAVYPTEQWKVAKALFRVLAQALLELQSVFAEEGACDFTELSIVARSVLSGVDGVAQVEAASGYPLRHLLIDEMQDTSTSQYDLIQRLTAGWTGEGRTLFLVGDPKQSLYLFRQARVERFVQTMRHGRLGDVSLGRIQLTENFRSQPTLVEQGNASFAAIFPRRDEANQPEEVPFVAATAARPNEVLEGAAETGMVWHSRVLPAAVQGEGPGVVQRHVREEAEQVREVITAWRSKPLPEGRSTPWRIAVLVRARADLREILTTLRDPRRGDPIPFRAIKIDPLKERQEVLDLHALTRALLHPADRLAWLAVLRAPWCGLGLAELHLLTGADDPGLRDRSVEDLIEQRGDLLGAESCLRLQHVWTVMRAAQRRGDLRFAERVERSWRMLGGDLSLSAEENANANRYLQMLEETEEIAGVVEMRELERRMGKLFAEATPADGAVDVMTIHNAKGLEWDMVVVPALGRGSPVEGDQLLVWEELTSSGQQSAGLLLAPVKGREDSAKTLNKWLRGLRRRREAAERKRVFYVAATRAREELHLFGAVRCGAGGDFSADAGSLLHAAWGAAKTHFPKDAEEMTLRFPVKEPGPETVVAIAARAETDAHATLIRRLPIEVDRVRRPTLPERIEAGHRFEEDHGSEPERPEGSFAVRSFGNAVHAFLELATQRYAEGLSRWTILREAEAWIPRIANVLRQDGLSPKNTEIAARRVLMAVTETLRDPVGEWILGAHAESVAEGRRSMWEEGMRSVRVDRSFRAGPEPLVPGTEYRWIVDYKTSTHASEGLDRFLDQQKEMYRGQMERYAQVMREKGEPARVGLYFVMLRRLVWWVAEDPGEAR